MTDEYIQKVLDGDINAFRFIIRRYKDNAYSLAMSVVKDEFIAEEVVQKSFIKSFTELKAFKGNAKFSTWFYRIVINEAFGILKKQKREADVMREFSSKESDNNMEFALEIDQKHRRYFINEALKKLSPKESLSLRLFYLEELSMNEMIEVTGWSLSNTKVILHRARKHLKRVFTELYNFDREELY